MQRRLTLWVWEEVSRKDLLADLQGTITMSCGTRRDFDRTFVRRDLPGGLVGRIPTFPNRPALDVSWKQNQGFGLPCVGCEQHVKTVGKLLWDSFPTYGQDDFRPVEDVDEVVPEETSLLRCSNFRFPSFFILHGIKDSSVEIKKEPNSTEAVGSSLDQGTRHFDNVEPQLLSGK
jgi:hypothetical protein